MTFSVEFIGGPTDRWHRWAMRDTFDDAVTVAGDLLNAKHVHGAAIREVCDSVSPWWTTS